MEPCDEHAPNYRISAHNLEQVDMANFGRDCHNNAGYTLFMPKFYTALVERDSDTGLLVGHVPGLPGAHSQGETPDELNRNLREVIEMLLEDGKPVIESEFVGTQLVSVG